MVSFEPRGVQATTAVQVDLLVWSTGGEDPRFWAIRTRSHICPGEKARTPLFLPPALRHLDIPGLAPRCLECRLVSVRLWRSPQSARPDRVRSQVGKGRTEVKAFSESASCKEAGPRGTAPGWGPESPRAQHWRNRLPCSLPGLGGLDPVDFRRDPWPAGRQSGAPSPRPSNAIQKPAHRAWPTATGCAA